MRPAKLDDIGAIVSVLCAMHEEARVKCFNFSIGKLAVFVRSLILDADGIVLVSGNPICGVLLGVVKPMWFGDDKEAFNLPFYVLPFHRGGPHAVRLIEAYKQRARELGAKDITLCINSGIAPDKVNGLVQRLGFTPIGGNFALES